MFMQLPLSIRALEGLRFRRTGGHGMLRNDARCGCGPPRITRHLTFGSAQKCANMSWNQRCADAGVSAEKDRGVACIVGLSQGPPLPYPRRKGVSCGPAPWLG